MSLSAEDQRACERIGRWLHARCGIYYPAGKNEVLAARLSRVVERLGIGHVCDLATMLERSQHPEIELEVVHAASTNHTYFFREPKVLDHFRWEALPELARYSDIRVWSAACSTGDEAYTLSILAAEALGRQRAAAQLAILGTDISGPAIARAEAGVYDGARLSELSAEHVSRYFDRVGVDRYQVTEDLRGMCTFRRLNLKSSPFPFQKPFHVVFCRNVLYYFDREHQRSTLEAIYDVTAPGGWLLTSVTEPVRELETRWRAVATGVYRRPR